MIEFSEMYRKYATGVFRFALYLSGNRGDAEDITSETFVRAVSTSDRIEESTVKGYLLAIARNLFLMGIRERSRRSELDDGLRDGRPTAFDMVARKAELTAVLDKLATLPAMDRAAVLLRTLDNRPYEEIAKILKISEVAARVKVHRARTILLAVKKGC